MTVYLKKLSILALFLMAATSANADLVPKKLWEFDFKEKTGYDLDKVDNAYMHFGGRDQHYSTILSAHTVITNGKSEFIHFWIDKPEATDGNVYDITNFYNYWSTHVLHMGYGYVVLYNDKSHKLVRLKGNNGKLIVEEAIMKNLRTSSPRYRQDRFIVLVTSDGNKITGYKPNDWVETEGGNTEPKIMFSKITPNEITIKGDTIKGGTIERSTDLTNWRKLVKVNKGGFEVFVDPTEKNKEFFRVKAE